jgi:acyl-CoA thioesterase I
MKRLLTYSMLGLVIFNAQACHASPPVAKLNYLPLGDSYTICEGATAAESWPQLLTNHLNAQGIDIALTDNPARTGYTTQNLIDRELPLLDKSSIDFVTICIGVNDWVQGVDSATFKKNLNYILDRVEKKIKNKKNILLITIPDFGVTPSGKFYGGGRNISEGLAAFNGIIQRTAQAHSLPVVDIFPVSKAMGTDTTLVARDGLHPSAKEYAIWETMILPEAVKLLKH